jgi:hypothetical protein
MQVPLQITFEDIGHSDAIEARIRKSAWIGLLSVPCCSVPCQKSMSAAIPLQPALTRTCM